MEKEAYEYHNYWQRRGKASMYMVPFQHYEKPSYNSEPVAYIFLQKAEAGPTEPDFRKIKAENIRDHVDLVLDELSRRDRITYQNLLGLYRDLLDIYQAKVQLDYTHFHTQSQAWRDLFKQELGLKRLIRSEFKEMYKDTSRASEELRRSLLEFKVQSQKEKLFSIEDALDR